MKKEQWGNEIKQHLPESDNSFTSPYPSHSNTSVNKSPVRRVLAGSAQFKPNPPGPLCFIFYCPRGPAVWHGPFVHVM